MTMKELYHSTKWKSLDELDRAQLLLVIEGLKRGTIIGGNWTYFMDIVKETGLDYESDTPKYVLDSAFVVAKADDLAAVQRRYLTLPRRIKRDEYHKISGWLLSYPECCTEEYVKKRTPEQRKAERNGQRYLSYKFGQDLDAKIKAEGSYPDIFDYAPPSFTPCGIDCPEAIKVLTSWKEAITTFDSEAGKELVYFNRIGLPKMLAHKEYWQQDEQRRLLEYKLRSLRNL
ncbi:MAG: DUF483 domain-containing protein [Nanoarchaeota archaeon]|nr:DUF483 domain-containing protein [Nanoarchaeota archaeon]